MNKSADPYYTAKIFRKSLSFSIFMFYLLIIMHLSGCAGTSTFTAYPKIINPHIEALSNRAPINFMQVLEDESKSKDLILYTMERGRMAQVTGNLDISLKDFASSMEQIKQNEEKARISASAIGANIAAAAINDNAIPYEGYGYEKIMLHHYQALNYVKKNDLESASVEVRRANAEQEAALKLHEEELEKAAKEAEEKKVDSGVFSQVDSQYAQMDEIAGKIKNSFQNAYTFYFSGLIYELNGQKNDAYIDYKKALEIYPENTYLQKDVLRLAKALGMREDLEALQDRFKIAPSDAPANAGELLVIYEDGFAPQKQEIKIPIPVPRVGLMAIAFPIYRESGDSKTPLTIAEAATDLGTTEPICDFRALAVKALKEQIPVITTRQVARALVKGAAALAAKRAAKEVGFELIGTIVSSAYNYVSENADLRSWITLPSNAQILRTHVAPGTHKIDLKSPLMPEAIHVDLEVPPNGKTILHVVRAGKQFYMSTTPFKFTTVSAQL